MENLVRYDGEKSQYQFKVEVHMSKKQWVFNLNVSKFIVQQVKKKSIFFIF